MEYVEQPVILMELHKNNEEVPLILEMNETEVEELLTKLKEIQKLII